MAGYGPESAIRKVLGGGLGVLAGVDVPGHTRGRPDLVGVTDGAVDGLLHRAGQDPEVVLLKTVISVGS